MYIQGDATGIGWSRGYTIIAGYPYDEWVGCICNSITFRRKSGMPKAKRTLPMILLGWAQLVTFELLPSYYPAFLNISLCN